jgi:endoglucanase
MVGTANWGGVPGLQNLVLPAACTAVNTIVTIHYYEPFQFTHQGAEWVSGSTAWIGTAWTGSAADQQPLLSLLDSVVSWNSAPGRGFELYMGEFGAYTKYVNPDYQKAWTAFIAREAEHRTMSWAYWEYCSGFGAYDPSAGAWRPQLIDALIPASERP